MDSLGLLQELGLPKEHNLVFSGLSRGTTTESQGNS